MVASLTQVGFKEVFNKKFTLEYQELQEEMNLVKMKDTESFKACVWNFNTQMNPQLRWIILLKDASF